MAGLPLRFEPKLFKDFFEEWIEERDNGRRRECTIAQYRYTAQAYLLPAFGRFLLTDITDVAITRLYKSWRKEGYAPATISFAHVLLGNMFKLAVRRGLILASPMNNVEPPGKPKPKPVAMNPEQTQKFLDAASARPEGFMFRLAFFLGARPCEYLALQWGDIDWQWKRVTLQRSLKLRKGGEWHVTAPKTESSVRSIPLNETFLKGLEEHRRRQLEARLRAGADWTDTGFIFTDELGQPLKMYNVRYRHRGICAAAGLPATFKLKVSRHSCASAMLALGVDLKTVSERLGHSSIAVIADVYTVVTEQKQREASERLAEAFGGGIK